MPYVYPWTTISLLILISDLDGFPSRHQLVCDNPPHYILITGESQFQVTDITIIMLKNKQNDWLI